MCCGSEGTARWCETCKTDTRYNGKIFHDFRRTASYNMREAGVPQAVAMKITGHRTDSMFRGYAIVDGEQKRNALQKTQEQLMTSKSRKVVRMGQSDENPDSLRTIRPFTDNEHDATD